MTQYHKVETEENLKDSVQKHSPKVVQRPEMSMNAADRERFLKRRQRILELRQRSKFLRGETGCTTNAKKEMIKRNGRMFVMDQNVVDNYFAEKPCILDQGQDFLDDHPMLYKIFAFGTTIVLTCSTSYVLTAFMDAIPLAVIFNTVVLFDLFIYLGLVFGGPGMASLAPAGYKNDESNSAGTAGDECAANNEKRGDYQETSKRNMEKDTLCKRSAVGIDLGDGGNGPRFPNSLNDCKYNNHSDNRTLCQKCDGWRPLRTHHCRICNRCIPMMDHHCPWIGNCVGEENWRNFVLYLFYTILLSVVAVGVNIYYMVIVLLPNIAAHRSAAAAAATATTTWISPYSPAALMMVMSNIMFNICLIASLGYLLSRMVYMTSHNLTGIDLLKKKEARRKQNEARTAALHSTPSSPSTSSSSSPMYRASHVDGGSDIDERNDRRYGDTAARGSDSAFSGGDEARLLVANGSAADAHTTSFPSSVARELTYEQIIANWKQMFRQPAETTPKFLLSLLVPDMDRRWMR